MQFTSVGIVMYGLTLSIYRYRQAVARSRRGSAWFREAPVGLCSSRWPHLTDARWRNALACLCSAIGMLSRCCRHV